MDPVGPPTSLTYSDLWPCISLQTPTCRVFFVLFCFVFLPPCLLHAEQWIPKRPGAGVRSARKNEALKAGGRKRMKEVKRTKKDGPSLKQVSAPTPNCKLRLAMGRHHLCCTCTCSKGQWEWRVEGKERRPGGADRSQQRCPQPARRQNITYVNSNANLLAVDLKITKVICISFIMLMEKQT